MIQNQNHNAIQIGQELDNQASQRCSSDVSFVISQGCLFAILIKV